MLTRQCLAMLALGLTWVLAAYAQGTEWPSFMARLEPGLSLSPVPATLPAGLIAQAVAADVPSDKARWLGNWTGWACENKRCDTKLFVESVNAEGAIFTYAFASERSRPFVGRVEGKFVGDELQGVLPSGAKLAYRFAKPGVLQFIVRTTSSGWSAGILQPIRDSAPSVPRLPSSLKGRYSYFASEIAKLMSESVEVQVSSQDAEGRISGTYSLYTVYSGRPESLCIAASRVPMAGTYDGNSLFMAIKLSTIAPICKDMGWTLHRGKDHMFEEAGPNGAWQIFLDSND